MDITIRTGASFEGGVGGETNEQIGTNERARPPASRRSHRTGGVWAATARTAIEYSSTPYHMHAVRMRTLR